MLRPNLPSINDMESSTVPAGLLGVVDAHVHIFPQDIFSAIWQWFDKHAWHIKISWNFPKLRIYLPHLGFDEISAYKKPLRTNQLKCPEKPRHFSCLLYFCKV
jgi:hypothetical protein